jgi:hypothetical protein
MSQMVSLKYGCGGCASDAPCWFGDDLSIDMYYIKAQVNNSIYTTVADTDHLDLRTDDGITWRIVTTYHSI